jgi:hypothetical protein
MGVFHKNQCYDKIFAKTSSSLRDKRQYFCQIFRWKYFKYQNIGPWYGVSVSIGMHKKFKNFVRNEIIIFVRNASFDFYSV